ncbi:MULTISPECIES: hypothetical protein [Pseudomonas]|uniref:Uncharacterized protein n=3 Tax=Pseudomonas chlororaphis TaxID=587753 RepID=A0AAQ0ART4_9PSED|nr:MULTISPECIES: hypothetical protein [Pseudomonas]AIC19452.1 hypothetical protein EY04_11265 [Pseudomonas chlororaphis]AUG40497.1 hypothetical protein CXP47_11605 [Pseudomonas chlororaphis]AZD47802.1 hypothetical protein C4K20_2387 [Pseudomonas chlororaphis subsp. aurantiaca]AZD54203.1 hypothetical protein C4K19_2416 [Pseudomonas chlororaphis subsp. aurantiaca]AZD60290.1 hypothetical protein C4K18_2317 [Pseudomonas chlororaphis subsp. aurantiaca]
MNLNNQPTIDELARMFAAQKDKHDSHILWIAKSGQVHIDCLSPHAHEEEFDKNNQDLLARLKMYRRGQGYVGKKAAADRDFIGRVLDTLKNEWQSLQNKSEVRVIDRFC